METVYIMLVPIDAQATAEGEAPSEGPMNVGARIRLDTLGAVIVKEFFERTILSR